MVPVKRGKAMDGCIGSRSTLNFSLRVADPVDTFQAGPRQPVVHMERDGVR